MSQPSNCICLTTTGRVLNQVVLFGVVFHHIRYQLTHSIKLMIAGENQGFLSFSLAGVRVFLGFILQENDLVDQIQYSVLLQDILPHIGHVDAVRIVGVTLTGIDTFAAAFVEGQEERGLTLQVGTHIYLVQVHGEVCQTTCLEFQQTSLGITLIFVLTDGILIILSAGIALQFKSEDGNAIQEDY